MTPDVEDDLFSDSARVVRASSTVVMRLMEQMQRRREEQARRSAQGQQQAAEALAERQKAQHETMRAIIQPARDSQWLSTASDHDIAVAYVYAEAYAGHDDVARHTRDSLANRLEARHVEVAAFVDSHISSDDIERVPVPEGAQLSPTQARLVAAREETAEKWANIFESAGPEKASQWIAANLDESERARIEARLLEDRAKRSRDSASEDRDEASELEGSEADEAIADANEHESEAASDEHEADLERYGRGQKHPHDPAKAQESRLSEAEQKEAAEAARAARGGRTEALVKQLEDHRNKGQKPQARHSRRPKKRERDREHSSERTR